MKSCISIYLYQDMVRQQKCKLSVSFLSNVKLQHICFFMQCFCVVLNATRRGAFENFVAQVSVVFLLRLCGVSIESQIDAPL